MSWLLAYPDTYEVGLPNQGLQILYEILNERDDAVAERTYAPWTDLDAAAAPHGVPLFSVDTHRAAGEFDLLAFNLSSELVFTNVLDMIDLAGVPVRAADRAARAPARRRRRPLGVQPRAAGRLRRPRRARRGRGGRRRDHRGRRRLDRAAAAPIATAVLRDLAQVPGRVRAVAVRGRLRRPGARRRHAALRRRAGDGRQAHGRRPRASGRTRSTSSCR